MDCSTARPLCPSPTPGVYSDSCPLSRWCHPTISSSVVPFSSCLQSFPGSRSFPMSQFFASGGQIIGVWLSSNQSTLGHLFSPSVMFDSLWRQGLQHARFLCPLLSPRDCSNSCLLSWWCYLSNHVIFCRPLLLLLSIFPSIRVFSNESILRIRWPKYWSFSFSISPSNEYAGLIPLGLTGLISLQSKGLSSVFSNTTVQKHQFFSSQLSSQSNSHIHTWPLEKS